MRYVDTTSGPIEVAQHGDSGRAVFFVGGLAMDASVWRKVIAALPDLRCVTMTQPLGSHRRPMRPDADLTLGGLARIQGEVMAALDLREAVLVGNDSGAFLATAVAEQQRLAGLVVTTCEAFAHFPPGLPGRSLASAARIPGAMSLVAQTLRVGAFRRAPTAYGWMSRTGIPDDVTSAWVRPLLEDPAVRRDLVTYLRTSSAAEMEKATRDLAGFAKPALVVWTPQDRVMDRSHGRRIADLLPSSTYEEITDSYTLVPEDQPEKLARSIRSFVERL